MQANTTKDVLKANTGLVNQVDALHVGQWNEKQNTIARLAPKWSAQILGEEKLYAELAAARNENDQKDKELELMKRKLQTQKMQTPGETQALGSFIRLPLLC